MVLFVSNYKSGKNGEAYTKTELYRLTDLTKSSLI